MSEIALFRIRNRPIFLLRACYYNLFLFSFAMFMIGGSFFRIFPLPPFPSYISVVEVAFYLFAFPIYFSKWRKSQLLALGIALSSLYGIGLHGIDLASNLYACKLIGSIAAGVSVGEVLYRKFRDDSMRCLKLFIRIFLGVLFFGVLIFILFPKAELFFKLLHSYGVQFTGDPHQRRFISPFFDPNYYSAIACIPLILTAVLRQRVVFGFFLASILLTFSRSGIATCMALLFCMRIASLLTVKTVEKRSLFLWSLMVGGLSGLLFYFSQETLYFFSRFFHMSEDPSAHARLETFVAGIDFVSQYPLFGVGYHYLSKLLEGGMGILSLDSSMLILVADFGLIPSLALLSYGIYWFFNRMRQNTLPGFSWLYIYLLLCVVFTSQFNNLLFYQYWLIPMIALFTYNGRVIHESSFCT